MEQKRNYTRLIFSLILIQLFGFLAYVGQNAYANQTTPAITTIIIEEAKLIASDAEDVDIFGIAVDIDNDTIIVGSHRDDGDGFDRGSAYIYERNLAGSDSWGEAIKLTSPDAADEDYFGENVSIDGDKVVIGAIGVDDFGSASGAAYIFERNLGGANNWGYRVKLTASDARANSYFGRVAISGDTVVVGASWDLGGSACIFERNDGGIDNWGEVKKLKASDAEEDTYFGRSVAIDGDTIIIGAYAADGIESDMGAAYIFERNQAGTDNWGELIKLTASDGEKGDGFGRSVAIFGDTIVVGAYRKDGNGSDRGAAYIYERNLGGVDNWGEAAKQVASDSMDGDMFGNSVDLYGNIVLVGAYRKNDLGDWQGSAYIYGRNEGGIENWGEVKKITPSDVEDYNSFGNSVAINLDTLTIGAFGNSGAGVYRGAAYVYSLSHIYNVFLPLVQRK
jgi:hypothetical protein